MRTTPDIRYALREDPYNVYQLTEGSAISRKHTQISIFRKREISVGFLSDYYYLDSRTKPMAGRLTPHGEEVRDLNWDNPYYYIVKVDSQIEFIVRRSLFEKLQESFAPIWAADTNINFYGDQPSGYMALLRVYRVKEPLNVTLLEKGRQGSAQIMKLYSPDKEEIAISTSIIEPVLSDARFEYLKDEILSLLKRENAFIALYNNTPDGIKLLNQRVEADRALKPKIERSYDPDSTADMAQTDYAELYRKLIQKVPGLEMLVNYVREVQPARWGEIDALTTEYQNGDSSVRQRIIDTHLRYAMRTALWVSERYRVDLEDAIQESIIGLLIATDKYSRDYDGTFGNYAPLWMRQNMLRELPIAEEICRLPVHFFERFMPIVDWIYENQYRIDVDDSFRAEAIQKIQQTFDCEPLTAINYLSLALPPESIEMAIERDDDELSDLGAFMNELDNSLDRESFTKRADAIFDMLNPREADIFKKRVGWGYKEMTLEEIGAEYDLTRERIRQIEGKALRRLRHPTKIKIFRDYRFLLDE